MIELIKRAKELVKHNKVKKIGGPGAMGQLYEVEEHTVRIYHKPGRNIAECSCLNGSRWCGEMPICVHKISVLLFEAENKFDEQLDKLIELYENWVEMKLPIKPQNILHDLKNLRDLK
ncbi:MAG: hypothetical protein KKB31_04430 [Nanoarchaeota archaeon]|nr:hypothetical protein [Nanoarchaeota archaeon]